MNRLKAGLLVMVAVFAIGAMSASAASAATGRVDVSGGSGCDYAVAGPVTVPSTISDGDIFSTACDVFGMDAEVTGDIDISAGGAGEIRLTPAGTDVKVEAKMFGLTLCTVTVAAPNYVSLTGVAPNYSGVVPVTTNPTPPTNATDSGAPPCPTMPYIINVTMTLP